MGLKKMLHFKLIVPMYNVEKWVEKTVNSIVSQNYTHFDCLFIDDASTDNTARVVEKLIKGYPNLFLKKNKKNKGGLRNLVEGIPLLKPKDNDVIVTVDGDDWLAHKGVLTRVAKEYQKTECYLTHGNFKLYPGNVKSSRHLLPIPKLISYLAAYRHYRWELSQLRTFKYRLWKSIQDRDLRDEKGNYFSSAYDLAIMFPMAEMANGHISFINETLYIYNRETPYNVDKVNRGEQKKYDSYIRKKNVYPALIPNSYLPQRVASPRTMKKLCLEQMRSQSRPEEANAYYTIALLLLEKESYGLAIRYCKKANQLSKDIKHDELMVHAYRQLGDKKNAMRCFKRIEKSSRKNYAIKESYISQKKYLAYNDFDNTDEYQDEVYKVAYELSNTCHLNRVLDIGCGSAYKLLKHFKNMDFVGLDVEPMLSYLRKKYPNYQWEESNFSKPLNHPVDIIVCADVIEHLLNPNDLLSFIQTIDFQYAVISTPERDVLQRYQKGYLWEGPPDNKCHIREWSFSEFKAYISQYFQIVDQKMFKNKVEKEPLGQYVIVKKEQKSSK